MNELEAARAEIDDIDDRIVSLFCRRMELARTVAAAKKTTGKAVFDPARERTKLLDVASKTPAEFEPQITSLFSLLMSMNKAEQQRLLRESDDESLSSAVRESYVDLATPFPSSATVACQGVEGAYSQIAASKLFRIPDISYFNTFEGVFRAVKSGFCEYGVLPIENSTAGSVNAVYDLLAEYGFFIVRSLRLKVDHCLLGAKGASLENVKEVFSHEQAIAQCSEYIDKAGFKVTVCENTAQAAKMMAECGRDDAAALSSRSCAELYGLDVLDENVQDSAGNYTRFVCVSDKPQVFPGATRTSLMITVPHDPGSLYRVLERFFALGINLVKLESRPIPGRDFEFMFYFDLDCPQGSAALDTLLDSLDDVCESHGYLGSYSEIL